MKIETGSEGSAALSKASGGCRPIVANGSGQTAKHGYHLGLNAAAETHVEPWIVGVGVGFFYKRMDSGGKRGFFRDDPDSVRQQSHRRLKRQPVRS